VNIASARCNTFGPHTTVHAHAECLDVDRDMARRHRRSDAGRNHETDGQPLCVGQMLAEEDEAAEFRDGGAALDAEHRQQNRRHRRQRHIP
jgi:hypothetical protein